VFATTSAVEEKWASLPDSPFQSPLMVSIVPLALACVTTATWSAAPPPW
jgi:hypothetical protein